MADSGTPTNPTIFLRLNAVEPAPRELAWDQFHARYAPIIAAFARRLGADGHDVDDIVQDVLLGFFATSPTFVYDPAQVHDPNTSAFAGAAERVTVAVAATTASPAQLKICVAVALQLVTASATAASARAPARSRSVA